MFLNILPNNLFRFTSFLYILLFIFVSISFTNCRLLKHNIGSFERKNILYSFAETHDKSFCNPDSIVATDCPVGYIYFTKKGNAIYNFYCLGSDSAAFNIGKYTFNDSSINCTFDSVFPYLVLYLDTTTEYKKQHDPNLNRIQYYKKFDMVFKKLNCKDFEYFTYENDSKTIYVLSQTDKEHSKIFLGDFSKIRILKNL